MRVFGLALALASIFIHRPVQGETLLAVGSLLGSARAEGGRESRPYIIRTKGDQWSLASIPAGSTGLLHGVAFSTAGTAWAFGLGADQSPLLLKSVDDGVTWVDASSSVAATLVVPLDIRLNGIAFADPKNGWLVGSDASGVGPFISATSDGGEHWTAFTANTLSLAIGQSISVRSGNPEIIRATGAGTSVVAAQSLGADAKNQIGEALFQGNAVTVADGAMWIAGASSVSQDEARVRAAIYRRSSDGSSTAQDLKLEGAVQLTSIHMRDATAGVAGGVRVGDNLRPVCLYTDDGGQEWRESTLPDDLTGFVVRGVARGSGGKGWSVGHSHSPDVRGSVILESSDGGGTWVRVQGPDDENGRLYAIAREP